MTSATVLRSGQDNGAGDAKANFLKVWSGEVLTSFEEYNIMKELQMVRSISSGKSAQFPATWQVNASYHTVGAEIVGQAANASERVISIDDVLIADVFLGDIDEAMNHWDARSVYTSESGQALARKFDTNSMQVALLAARASATVTGAQGGTVLTSAGYGTTGSTIASGLFAAAEDLDDNFIPENDRYAIFRPAQYYLLAQTTDAINRDWGGMGAYAEGTVLKIAGLHVLKSPHLPSTNVTTGPTAYQGNFTTTTGLVFHKSTMGTVKLMDLSVRADYDPRRLGTLVVAKYALGHGILRPESSVELKTS